MATKQKILWITQTATFVAMLVVIQMVTAPLGNTFITGSIVNLILIISVLTSQLSSGISIAAISPIIAKFFGVGGAFWSLVPFIIIANVILVSLWYLICHRNTENKLAIYLLATFVGASAKFLILYLGIVKIAIPIILDLPEKQAALLSNVFSIPQFFTALIGGIIVTFLLPTIKKALSRK